MPALPGNKVKGALLVSGFRIRSVDDVSADDEGPNIRKTRLVARFLHGKKSDERPVRFTRFTSRDRGARQGLEISYDRFLVFQCLVSNSVFIILTDSQQETAHLLKFRDVAIGGVYAIAEPMFRGVMGDGVKIIDTKEYMIPSVYDNERLVNPATLPTNVGFKAFGMENVKIRFGPVWIEDRVCSGETCDRQYSSSLDCLCLARGRRNSWVLRCIVCSPELPGGECEMQSYAFSKLFLPPGILENPLKEEDIDVFELRDSMDRIAERVNGTDGVPLAERGWTIYGWYKP
ncbi:hypothetical protein FOL47_003488, partial [Perkinsus chesapeaki]